MRIVFLCSCLEPGRDGVGDYTRRLATELIKQGHFSAALSLNDSYISDKFSGVQASEHTNLQVLRLPALWLMKDKLSHAKKYIDEFDPDWISLQFVIFGFHHKGLPFRLSGQLSGLAAGRKLHVMFHELWVGMEIEASKKYKWWGRAQRLLIRFAVSKLNPSAIHTNTTVYNLQLAKLGIQSKYLPLFPNIPVINTIPKVYSNDSEENTRIIMLLVFGAIHLDAPIDALAKEAATYAKENNTKMILRFLGKSNKNELTRWVNTWQAYGMDVEVLGEQSAEYIAEIFAATKFGITATALAMTEKSGSVALMKAYGIKVLCVSRPWTPHGLKEFTLPGDVFEYIEGNFNTFINSKINRSAVYCVSEISSKLVNDLALA